MNIFTNAKIREKINKLPYEYNIVKKGKSIIIKSEDISWVKIANHCYMISAFDVESTGTTTVFKDFIEFHLFVYDNFYKLEQVFCNKLTVSSEYFLKNGFIHNENGPAYIKYNKNDQITNKKYYLNGRETNEEVIKRLVRIKKLNRLV
ncbi:MAG: hypothetical protein HPY57_13315 [Ignavibacteria bacterium]|nr:hypothetical protein [Bacteroidales bacterium]NPV12760.1 hypothetical protein [Ignavibacteria bacterium]